MIPNFKFIVFILILNFTFIAKSQNYFNVYYNLGTKNQLLGNQNFSKKNNNALEIANNAALISNDSLLKFGFSTNRISSVNLYSFAASKSIKNSNAYLAFQTIPLGKIDEYTSNGTNSGQFNASINSLSIGYGYKIRNFSFGTSSRFNVASIQNYQNLNLSFDINGMYENNSKDFCLGWNIRNISIFNQNKLSNFEIRPNVSIGGSISPKYIPIKLHFSSFDLIEKRYKKNFALGLEVFENKPFNLFLGYNNAEINKIRTGFRIKKSKYSFLIGTEFGQINTQYFELNYYIKSN